MSQYLERYKNGDYVQVWEELVALGDTVQQEPILSEARAVANETMRRARHNIEVLVKRLKALGFQFQDPKGVFVPTTKEQFQQIADFESEVGALPLSVRAWIDNVGEVSFMGTYPRLSYYASDDIASAQFAIGTPDGGTQILGFDQMMQEATKDLDKLEKLEETGDFPSPLLDMYKSMQGLLGNLSQQNLPAKDPKPKPSQKLAEADQIESDPLVVFLHYISLDGYYEREEYLEEDDNIFYATIAPDLLHKSGISGSDGAEIGLAGLVADAPIRYTEWGEKTFVEFLRYSFEWAGFPGLKNYKNRDDNLLASLKKDLLPL